MREKIGIGLVGSGFMGRAHANAFRSVSGLFKTPFIPELVLLADRNIEVARAAAAELGFSDATGDWKALVNDPRVDIVAITAPNVFHEPIAVAALAAGKHVYCEKPLAADIDAARRMAAAAAAASNLVTMVGFNFLRNPMIRVAKEIIDSGEIGAITSFRGIHAEDYMSNPLAPHSFRTDIAGGGALNDIGSHIISMAQYLLGSIVATSGITQRIFGKRPVANGSSELRDVEVDDRAVFLARFERGIVGSIEAAWAATGRKMQLGFEIGGTKGSIAFDQSRFNELQIYEAGQSDARSGFKTIESGPQHPPYGTFCPAPGHQIGFNDLKVVEVSELLSAIDGGPRAYPDFSQALQVQLVTDCVHKSSAENGAWVNV